MPNTQSKTPRPPPGAEWRYSRVLENFATGFSHFYTLEGVIPGHMNSKTI